jgi:uncharacterized SAM-binding protein YcdF (DUF218 family)
MGSLLWLVLPNGVHLLVVLGVVAVALGRRPGRAGKRWQRLAWAAVGVVWVLTTPAIANGLVRGLEGPPAAPPVVQPDSRTRILVLASGELFAKDGSTLSRLTVFGWERARGGVLLWRQSGGTLVFSGGPSGDPQASIADAMAQVARDMGVPDAAIEISPAGTNTYDEMAGARGLLAGEGARWLVTSASHMPRALQVASCLGLPVKGYPVGWRQIVNVTTASWLPDPGAPEVFQFALHEWVGMVYYRLRHGC